MVVPEHPKLYHIVHLDRLPSIVAHQRLLCDVAASRLTLPGTVLGISHIKERRLRRPLRSCPGLCVGECVPFYFCPRSVMLYLLHRANHPELSYRGGQEPIVHLEADVREVVDWAQGSGRRWAFTGSNAGGAYFEEWSDLAFLEELDWPAIQAGQWIECKEGKQAEFLLGEFLPLRLVQRIGVCSRRVLHEVSQTLSGTSFTPKVEIKPDWYY